WAWSGNLGPTRGLSKPLRGLHAGRRSFSRMNSHPRTEPAAVPPEPQDERDRVAATVVRPALPRFVLRGVSGAGFGRTFPLVGPTVLGRAADCGIHLDH